MELCGVYAWVVMVLAPWTGAVWVIGTARLIVEKSVTAGCEGTYFMGIINVSVLTVTTKEYVCHTSASLRSQYHLAATRATTRRS